MTEEFWTEEELSKDVFKEGLSTTRRRRTSGMGPPFIRLGRRYRYRRSSVLKWLRARAVDCDKEAKNEPA
jgi:hypothetical protein